MIRKTLFILLCLSLLCSCNAAGSDAKVPEIGEQPSNYFGLEIRELDDFSSLELQDFKLQDSTISFTLHNTGELTFCYGLEFRIEKYQDDTWYPLVPQGDGADVAFTDSLYTLSPDNSEAFHYDLAFFYEAERLETGDYRILHSFGIDNQNGDIESFYLSIPFTVD